MNQNIKSFFTIVGIFVLIYIIWLLRLLIGYIMISAVLAIIISPMIIFFHRRKIGKFRISYNTSVIIVMLLIVSIIIGFVSILAPVLIEQSRIISSINVNTFTNSLKEPLSRLQNFVQTYQLTDNPHQSANEFIQSKLKGVFSTFSLTNTLAQLMSTVGSFSMAFVSVVFITFFFVKDRNLLIRIVFSMTPDRFICQAKEIIRNTRLMLSRYFTGVLIEMSLITICVTIGLSIIGVKNAFAIGFFAGIINIIPYVGPLISVCFGSLVCITSNMQLDFNTQIVPMLMKVVSVYATVSILDNFLFQPYIFSNSVKSHPLEIFIVIIAAATFAGVPGMIVAVPLYTFFRIIAKEFLSHSKIVRLITKNL